MIASLLCPRLAATTAHAVASTAALATALAAQHTERTSFRRVALVRHRARAV